MLLQADGQFAYTANQGFVGEDSFTYRAEDGHGGFDEATATITVLGLQLGGLLAGAVVTETIFAWPGVGRLLVQAIGARDYPLVQGCVLAVACTYVLANLLTDLAQAALDPRLRERG